MKGECIKDKLKYAVGLAEKVTGKNLSLPILSTVLIEARDSSFVLKATNLDVGIEYSVPAKIESPGMVAVSGSTLSNLLGAVTGDDVIRLEAINDNLALATKRTSTIIKSLPHEDFPIIPRIEGEESFTISASVFTDGIRSVWYSASLSDVKPEIASIYLYQDGGDLVFVATDSFRLAEKRVPLSGATVSLPILIPYKNASDLVRVFENEPGNIEVRLSKNQMAVVSGTVYFTTRLVSGVFPNYRQIMPTARKTRAVLEKRDLTGSLKLSSIFADRLNQITLKIVPADSLFEAESKNQDTGENTTLLEGSFEGEEIQIGFNAKYILDSFQSIPEEKIAFDLNGPGKPLVIRGVRDQSFTYLVMPMNR